MKRRFKYGTVMVNVETGKITDLLESRETSEVSKWLITFPNIRIVSRDGSKAFKKAISEAFPTAIQVTDRFHLISRLIQIITNYLFSLLPSRITIPISSEREETDEHFFLYASRREKILFVQDLYFKKHLTMQEIRMKTGFSLKTIDKYCSMAEADIPPDTIIQRAREHETTTKAKQKRVTEVLSLRNHGRTVEEIADITGYTRQTINRYLSPNYSPEHANYGVDFPGRLSKHRKKVLQLRKEGKTYKEVYNIIKTEGYDGSVDAIRGFMARQRRIHKDVQEKYCDMPVEIIERKWLVRLLYNPIEEVPVIKPEDLPIILKEYPAYKNSAEIVWEFRHIVSKHQVEDLKKWIIQARSIPFGELDSFLNGIEQDIEAVSYALTHSYNNGLAEGSINKIKTIKQQMYGRCTFALLRNKVLLLEDWYST